MGHVTIGCYLGGIWLFFLHAIWCSLVELKGTVGPWQRYELYCVPFLFQKRLLNNFLNWSCDWALCLLLHDTGPESESFPKLWCSGKFYKKTRRAN